MTKMLKEILEQPIALKEIESNNKNILEALVKNLNERNIKHTLFAARGTSDHACIFGQYILGLYKGVVAALAIPSSITLYGGTLDLEDYLIIGVSQSGKAADALAVIEQ